MYWKPPPIRVELGPGSRAGGRLSGPSAAKYQPQVSVIPARKRHSPFSPDDPQIVAPLLQAEAIFMGPGSPTYAVRQLQDTLAWHIMVARHRLGSALILASASTLAISAHTLPVYEIYKVGEELHWHLGLDFLGLYGLSLVVVPHWNNSEGGPELDTSRCFMGRHRFEQLMKLLPPKQTIVGLDEHTALILDLTRREVRVMGKSGVTLLTAAGEEQFQTGQTFDIHRLGPFRLPHPETVVPAEVWATVQAAHAQTPPAAAPPAEVRALVEARQIARARQDWPAADHFRHQLAEAGWQIKDTPQGPVISRQ
jgi:hypothetical protein